MGGRMKYVIVSINPLGRFLYIHDVRVQTRVSLFAQQRPKKVMVHQSYIASSSYSDREKM